MYIFCMIILIFFAIIGICAFITALLDCFYHENHQSVLILSDLSVENAEARLRWAARICQRHKGMKLRCICKEDDPAYDICFLMKKEYPMIELRSEKGSADV